MNNNYMQKSQKKTKPNVRDELSRRDTLPRDFFVLFNFFSDPTRDILSKIFYKAMKVVYFKFKRKKDIWEAKLIRKNKPLRDFYPLSKTDISNSIYLVDHYLSNLYIIPPECDPLSKFGHFPYDDAIKFYEEYVEGSVKDIYGREIVLDENGLNSLFDHDPDLNPKNYSESRGKRLPWIIPTLRNSKGIYEFTERSWTTYYYISALNVPYKDKATGEVSKVMHYFFIVIRKEAGKPLTLITAYHFDKELMFLKFLEPAHPFIYMP
ncbi:MAG: hypothetical protein PHC54_02525 [Candidatus Omnitrophica bacterium]|nr:hypothetical protein [Candidatus Omnitrophota bacterium]MDD5592251.1 hypothetical protein [Candidatus Omnitrophota bacterium]